MTSTPVEELAKTFVELADIPAGELQLDGFLRLLADRCVRLLEMDAAGLVLDGFDGDPHAIGVSGAEANLAELLDTQREGGPGKECAGTGRAVLVPDLSTVVNRWPRFVAAARKAGFAAAHTLPMRLRTEVLGTLTLFRTAPGALDHTTESVAQAMADIATISLVRESSARRQAQLAGQLQHALHSRVVIEQAKGVIGERLGMPIEEAFTALRSYARANNRLLAEVAAEVVDGTLDAAALVKTKD